jgi:hypothetical protein
MRPEIIKHRIHATKCTFCDRIAFAAQYIRPAMCKTHYEVALLISRLRRQGRPVTVETVSELFRRQMGKHACTEGELPGLLYDLTKGDQNVHPHSR